MSFEHSGWGGKRVEVAPTSALLWCWGIMSSGIVYGYLEHYRGDCVMVIHDQTCTVQPTTVADILKADQSTSSA